MERSQEKELIDLGPDYYTHDEYIDCLKKLFQISRLLGFFRGTVRTLKYFSKKSSVLDIGCGGGLFLLNLSKNFPDMNMLGIDISSAAITHAQQLLQIRQRRKNNIRVLFQQQEQPQLNIAENSYDIILATLVCHHLNNDELITFLKQAYFSTRKIVIINDLHRHSIACWLYKLLSPLLFRNRLITHDGLISIRRGFTRAEWKMLLQKAGIQHYQLKWCFPFCWKVVLWK